MAVNDPTTGMYNAVTQRASAQAQSKYYDALAAGQSRDDALKEAQFAWQKELDVAGQTGMWNGQWNMPSNQWFTSQFGEWMPGGPQAGQQTMSKQQQDYAQAMGLTNAFGQYYAPGTAPGQGAQTLAAQNQAQQLGLSQGGLTGYYTDPQGNRQQTLAGQQQQWQQGFSQQGFEAGQRQLGQQNTQQYLQLLSSLRGPADWAKYQQVLGATPGGMRDLYAAAAGQYVPGGGATTGMQPQAANLTTMMQQVAGQPVTWTGQGSVPQGQLTNPMAQQYPQGGQMQLQGGLGMGNMGGPQAGQFSAMTNAQQMPGGGMQDMRYTQGQSLPGGNQWLENAQQGAAQAWAQQPKYQYTTQQQQPTPATTPTNQDVGSMVNYSGWGGSGPMVGQQQYQQGQQQISRGGLGMGNMGGPAWGSGIGVGQQPPTPAQQQQATGNGTNMYGAQQQQYNLPAPNQISSQAWNNFTPSQQQMMLGDYESQGWDKGDVQALYNQSLPKYGTNNASAGTWRLH